MRDRIARTLVRISAHLPLTCAPARDTTSTPRAPVPRTAPGPRPVRGVASGGRHDA
ncbi:hypothetical protein [Streptomyces sp. NPDC049906]|uniref:hypothetical protein n=1 Tax=Streptomyces sp. NPDC049906 TaxID=3155656 RepID=UPI0034325729